MITLKNVSEGRFMVQGEEILEPKGRVELENKEAERLLALFPDQLEKVGETAEAPAAESGEKAPADMTVVQIRAELESRGVKFERTVDKAGLVELLTAARAAAPAAETAPVETPEAKAAREAAEKAGLTAPAGNNA